MNFALSCTKTKAEFDQMGEDSQDQNDFTENCRAQNICVSKIQSEGASIANGAL